MFDQKFFFSRVGPTELPVKVGYIDKPGRQQKNENFLKKTQNLLKLCFSLLYGFLTHFKPF